MNYIYFKFLPLLLLIDFSIPKSEHFYYSVFSLLRILLTLGTVNRSLLLHYQSQEE